MPRVAEEKKIEPKLTTVKKSNSLSAILYDLNGKEIETIELPKSFFGVMVPDSLLTQYVRVYRANQRSAKAKTKTRGQVIGSTRKIYRQKGTGRARHGANKAPIFVGGGVAHGPTGQVFSLDINKKQRQKALFAALSSKLKNKEIKFVKGMLSVMPKTKEMKTVLAHLAVKNNQPVLVTFPKEDSRNMVLSSRNIANVQLRDVQSLNAFDILTKRQIIFAYEGLPVLIKHYEK